MQASKELHSDFYVPRILQHLIGTVEPPTSNKDNNLGQKEIRNQD